MQTYHEYLETMKAYRFCPVVEDLWQSWQVHYHGFFLTEKPAPADAVHAPGTVGHSNVLCLNGSAHRKVGADIHGKAKGITCPACLAMLKTGCDAVTASEAWKK